MNYNLLQLLTFNSSYLAIQKMPPNNRKAYPQAALIKVVASVQNGMKLKEVSEKYGIPISTISDKRLGRYNENKLCPGPVAMLSQDRE